MLARHADVQRVSRDSATFSNAPHPFLDAEMPEDGDGGMTELLISQDPPMHTKLRKLINKGFTPRRVAELEDRVRDRVDSIVDALAGRDECDLVTDIALWLPLHVIADLVGVPEEDREQVFHWTELTFGFDESVTPEERSDAATAMFVYADGLCEQRRAEPRDDLLSVLLTAEVDGETLTQLQIDLFFMLLQNAGSETTRNLLTTGMIVLLQHPEELARLRADLALLPVAVEELLRWVSPVMQFTRRATNDTEIGGRTIAAGERVVLVVPVGQPRRARVRRARPPRPRPRNRTITSRSGRAGPHFCLGANLARFEARIMFEALLTRFDGLDITGSLDTLPRVHSNLIDGYAHVPIRWDALAPAGRTPMTRAPKSSSGRSRRPRPPRGIGCSTPPATSRPRAVTTRSACGRSRREPACPCRRRTSTSRPRTTSSSTCSSSSSATRPRPSRPARPGSAHRRPRRRDAAPRGAQRRAGAEPLYRGHRAYIAGSADVAHARPALEASTRRWIDLALGDTDAGNRARSPGSSKTCCSRTWSGWSPVDGTRARSPTSSSSRPGRSSRSDDAPTTRCRPRSRPRSATSRARRRCR